MLVGGRDMIDKIEDIRFFRVITGFIMLMFIGIIYAWSILSSPLSSEFSWSSSALGINFTIVMSCFCMGGVINSVIQKYIPSPSIIRLTALMILLGFLFSSRLKSNCIFQLYVSYGFILSLGVGIAYNMILSCLIAWYPEKKGTISGFLLMGFGSSSLIIGSLANKLIGISTIGWRKTYIILGIAIFLILLIGSSLIKAPNVKDCSLRKDKVLSNKEISTKEMIKLKSFWLVFLITALANGIGTGIIGHCKFIAIEGGASPSLAALIVGILSLCNGLGRLFFGAIFDKLGVRNTLLINALTFLIASIFIIIGIKNYYLIMLIIGMAAIGFSYGGSPTISAAFVGSQYGRISYSSNLSIINLSMLPASIMSTIAGRLQTASGSYLSTLILMIVMNLIIILLNYKFKASMSIGK